MKAVKYEKFGPADVIASKEAALPEPKDNEILGRIHETTMMPTDPGIALSAQRVRAHMTIMSA